VILPTLLQSAKSCAVSLGAPALILVCEAALLMMSLAILLVLPHACNSTGETAAGTIVVGCKNVCNGEKPVKDGLSGRPCLLGCRGGCVREFLPEIQSLGRPARRSTA
ncbi:hypothetical protein MTO96_042301, partial [Rhipicephalus appendiculatus]